MKDAEAVVQSERFSVFTEEVDQLAAFLLQLLPTTAQRAQRRGGRLRHKQTQTNKHIQEKHILATKRQHNMTQVLISELYRCW